MESGLYRKKLLFSELSGLLNEPDCNRQVTILKEQIYTLLNGRIDPLCRGQLTAWQTVYLGLSRHLSGVVQEMRAGQLRCAMELGLLLWRTTVVLSRYAGAMESGFALLAGEQAARLVEIKAALSPASDLRRLEPYWEAIEKTALWPDPDPLARLAAGDLRPAGSVCRIGGELLLAAGTETRTVSPEANPLVYAQLLLLLRQYDALYEYLLRQPELIMLMEEELALLSPDQRRTLLAAGLRAQADSARSLTRYAHMFNLLLSLYPDAPTEILALTSQLRRQTGRSGLQRLLERLLAYFQEQALSGNLHSTL